MKKLMLLLMVGLASCTTPSDNGKSKMNELLPESTATETIQALTEKVGEKQSDRIKRGVTHAASLWRTSDGTAEEFKMFCLENFIAEETERKLVFEKVSKNLESLYGHFNKVSLDLQENLHLNNGPLHAIDKQFAGFAPDAHLTSDLYENKIAFLVALNFPYFPLNDKEELGKNWSRLEWAYARLGDQFTARVPAELTQAYAKANTDADIYISEYNIHMGHLRTEDNRQLFPDDMVLLSHWNLRDEIKANYANAESGLEKQELIYQVMERIISQEIPEKVINNPAYEWKPESNELFDGDAKIEFTPEPDTRYLQIINNFKALRAIDAYNPAMDSYIKRKFSGEMEIPQEQVEALFDNYLRSEELQKVGKLIAERLGRDLRPYDIWYDGFKARSTISEDFLSGKTTTRYPNAKAVKAGIPAMLTKLGWSKERTNYLASKIDVDAARGSGHAWGASMKGETAHLRTRIPAKGMDYKGYNIAIHELGHNVEQTISLYDMDYYMMNGVPNTAFTEALAFIFQSRDLYLLNIDDKNPMKEHLKALDASWSLMEIMGVGMVDMKVWKWLYAHPEATPAELKAAVIATAKEVWNTYYAPVFGLNDSPILGIYSHMISYPLYLSAYSYGQVIEFQLEEQLKGRSFADEIDRIFAQGRLIPQLWMEQATGSRISTKPILKAVDEALTVM